MMISKLLDTPDFVYYVQMNLNTNPHFWVDTEEKNKEIVYKMNTISQEGIKRNPCRSKFIDFRRDKRIKISLTNNHDLKLSLLSKSCNTKKAEMLAILLHFGLDDSHVIMYFQDRYNIHAHYWVTPLEENGQVVYLLAK